MGSGSQVVEEAVSYLTAQGQKVGLIKVRGDIASGLTLTRQGTEETRSVPGSHRRNGPIVPGANL